MWAHALLFHIPTMYRCTHASTMNTSSCEVTWMTQHHEMGALRLMYPVVTWSRDRELKANTVLRLL